jgi:hypothetical protein
VRLSFDAALVDGGAQLHGHRCAHGLRGRYPGFEVAVEVDPDLDEHVEDRAAAARDLVTAVVHDRLAGSPARRLRRGLLRVLRAGDHRPAGEPEVIGRALASRHIFVWAALANVALVFLTSPLVLLVGTVVTTGVTVAGVGHRIRARRSARLAESWGEGQYDEGLPQSYDRAAEVSGCAVVQEVADQTGWPIVSIVSRDGVTAGYMVYAPDGGCLDATGRYEVDEVMEWYDRDFPAASPHQLIGHLGRIDHLDSALAGSRVDVDELLRAAGY